MRKSKFSEVQIAAILKAAEAGLALTELARKHGISAATFYQWRSIYGGMEASDLKWMLNWSRKMPGSSRCRLSLPSA